MDSIKKLALKLNQMVEDGNLTGAFNTYYGDKVVVQRNGSVPLKGKEHNRSRELKLLQGIHTFHSAEVQSVAFGKNVSMTEWAMDITYKKGRTRRTNHRVSVQHWKHGKVISERLYFCEI